MAKHDDTQTHRLHQVGHWMPPDYNAHHKWLGGVIAHVDKNKEKELHPVLQEFRKLIESNTRVYMLISSMFAEVPKNRQYSEDPTGCPQIRDYHHMLQVLNYILTTAPSWNDFSLRVGLVGLPINAVLDWSMGTPSGYAAYLDPDINAMIKKVLNAWGEYLTSPDSREVLGDDQYGWFGEVGKGNLMNVANMPRDTGHQFDDLFVCEPSKPYHGFKSWDDFFTRLFREGVRPVAGPDDDRVVVNACESQPYKVARGVKERDTFWIKSQPYSVFDMLSHDEFAPQFVGGTVYQAFLSALSYHRWHAPVSGKIVKAYVVDGTYYSEPLFEGLWGGREDKPHGQKIDKGGEVTTQEYLSCVATRAIIFIECDNPDIGLMAFLGIGMCEVSTCDITVKEGQHIKKGEQLGMFHFGGSTHCLLFRKGVELEGFPSPDLKRNVAVNSQLAVVKGA
ncbi:Phophatidylserine decarboxylase-domain-containing protein [Aspergillus venezuelensis]